tara:strand:+ start:338 stop:475 length:138 start_codon:yes stop_codon:yes gene_type:complete
MKEYKTGFEKNSSSNTVCLEENKLLPKDKWFKGSRDRGFRGNIAA